MHATARNPEKPLTRQQFAAAIGVSIDTVDRLAQRGEVEILAVSPRRRVILASELRRFLAQRSARGAR